VVVWILDSAPCADVQGAAAEVVGVVEPAGVVVVVKVQVQVTDVSVAPVTVARKPVD
jgi:hypothetical protein